jgi:hypothetical protein
MSSPPVTEHQREQAKTILADLQRGRIYMDECIDKLVPVIQVTVPEPKGYDYSGMAWYIDRLKTSTTFNE